LNNNGFILATEGPGSPGNETNYFGMLTQAALINFQKANNIITSYGMLDLPTRIYLGCIETEQPEIVSTPFSFFNFTRDLKIGMIGEDVKELQVYLNRNGFILATEGPGSPGNETNYFGMLTQAALINFQKANNISPAAGYFGPATRGVANK
ncbi:MAG: peptidoglycan-binding domain-containing protein, partial [Patescibacteria group bacterium]